MRSHDIPDVSTVDYLRALKRTEGETSASTAVTNAASGSSSDPIEERRGAPRYRCAGSVEFRTEGSDFRTWATVADISRSGCYVEIQATSPPDTAVDMILDVLGVRLRVKGKVRIAYPFLGMGIAFTDIFSEDRTKLEELLLGLSRNPTALPANTPAPQATEAAVPASEIVAIADTGSAINALVEFFQTHDMLSRAEFLALIRSSQKLHSRPSL